MTGAFLIWQSRAESRLSLPAAPASRSASRRWWTAAVARGERQDARGEALQLRQE